MNTPTPREWETRFDFLVRFVKHAASIRLYPNAAARRAAGEVQWSRAKAQSLVSVKTEVAEVLLFD